MSIQINKTTLTTISKELNAHFEFEESYSGYDSYTAEIKNPLPKLFKEVKLQIIWNNINATGEVCYQYTHPNGSTNGYNIGFIRNGKFEHTKSIN